MFLSQLFSFLKPETVRGFVDSGLDKLEAMILASETKYDDTAVLPIISMIRSVLGIPHGTELTDPVVIADSKLSMISTLLTGLFNAIPSDMIKGFIDAGLDIIENNVAASETKYDDMVVLPIITIFRTSFNIPDNDIALITAELKSV